MGAEARRTQINPARRGRDLDDARVTGRGLRSRAARPRRDGGPSQPGRVRLIDARVAAGVGRLPGFELGIGSEGRDAGNRQRRGDSDDLRNFFCGRHGGEEARPINHRPVKPM